MIRSKKNYFPLKILKVDEILFLLLWCSGYIGAKIGIPLSGTFTLLFYRYLLVFLLVFCYLLLTKKIVRPTLSSLKRNFVMGFFAHFIWLVAVLKAFEYGLGAGSAALIASFQPILTALITPFVLKESNNKWVWLGVVTGFIGVLVYTIADLEFNEINVFIYLLPLLAALSLTFITIYERKKTNIKNESQLDVSNALFWQSVITLLLLLPFAFFVEKFEASYSLEFLFSVGWLAVVVSIFAYGIMLHLIRTRSANRVSTLQYFTPPITMIIAFIVFQEHQSIYGYVGLFIIGVGFAIFSYGETLKQKTNA